MKGFYILILPEGSDDWNDARPFSITLVDGIAQSSTEVPLNNIGTALANTSWTKDAIKEYAVTKMEFFTGMNSFSHKLPSGGTWACIMLYGNGGASVVRTLAGGSTWSEAPMTAYHCFTFRTNI